MTYQEVSSVEYQKVITKLNDKFGKKAIEAQCVEALADLQSKNQDCEIDLMSIGVVFDSFESFNGCEDESVAMEMANAMILDFVCKKNQVSFSLRFH